MNTAHRQALDQQPVQVGAMDGEVGCAEPRRSHGFERLAKAQMRVIERDRNDVARLAGELAQRRLDAERTQDLDRVGPQLQAGADLAKLARALVDLDLPALRAQRAGGGEPADARADHRDARCTPHGPVLSLPSIPELLAHDALVEAVPGVEQ